MQFFLSYYILMHLCVSFMRGFNISVVTVLSLMLLVGVVGAVTFGPSSGSVQYRVTVSGPVSFIGPVSAVVNETVEPSGQSGIVDLTMAIASGFSNLTYSRDVNSSSLPEIFPFLPDITNQSLSYQIQGFSIAVDLGNTGQVPVTFEGTSYQATRYLVSFQTGNSSMSLSGNGTITSLPSGVIDTMQLSLNQTVSVIATLLSTDLSVNAPASSVNPVGASLLGIGIVAAIIVAVPTVLKKATSNRHKHQEKEPQSEESAQNQNSDKPSYEVD